MTNRGRLIISVAGKTLTPEEMQMLAKPAVAGVILFTANYQDPDQIKQLIGEIQRIAVTNGKSKGMPIFIDQEGGYVQRFGRGFESLPAPKAFSRAYDINSEFGKQFAHEYGAVMAAELSAIGVIPLGPVCDLDAGNQVITGLNRAFHAQPQACTELLFSYISGMHAHKVPATGKHFPGHGQKIGDSHIQFVTDTRSLEVLEENDLKVFKALIEAKQLAAIMPAHIIYSAVDPDHTAGSSKIWLEDILRIRYGFDGIIVSDCLSMKGAGDNSLLDKTKQALAFGDVAIICHQPTDVMLKLLDDVAAEDLLLPDNGNSQTQQRFEQWVDASAAARLALMPQVQISAATTVPLLTV